LFGYWFGGKPVRVQLARLRVEGFLERRRVNVQMARQREEGEEICAHQLQL